LSATRVLERESWLRDTLGGLGYELVDLESSRGGLLRIFIDSPSGITVEDCARVSNHLTRAFAVEGIEYERLEVSSPGLDRPLRKPADFARFAGSKVDVKMRTRDESGRKRFTGLLRGEAGGVATLEVEGREVALRLDEIDRARLVPDLQGKGKK
jgi:ribosome maturation factor RimP